MRVGTKSLLFGVHQFAIHPWFVAYSWWKLYGFPWDPRLWVAFFVHDWGYWGCRDMDGPEGEYHPKVGAYIMSWLFDLGYPAWYRTYDSYHGVFTAPEIQYGYWGNFVYTHSRFLAKKIGRPYSKLCVADKLCIVVTPAWLYFALGALSGEIDEYLERARTGKYKSMNIGTLDKRLWYRDMRVYLLKWVEEHKDCKEDTWTPA